jgi:hypothetical protein
MKNDRQSNLTYTFLIIYIALIIYVIFARIYFNLIRGLISEHTPIEIVTPIIVFISFIIITMIWIKIKSKLERIDRFILIFGMIFLIIFIARELNVRYFHWSPIDVIGFMFLLIFTHRLWQVNKYCGYYFIFGILAILIAQATDIILDAKILSDPEILRVMSIVEESFELFAALFFLNSIFYLWILIRDGKNPFNLELPNNVFLISWFYEKR